MIKQCKIAIPKHIFKLNKSETLGQLVNNMISKLQENSEVVV